PLSKPGFETLLRVFPNMTHLEYTTNFQTFDNQFQDVTREMFDAESSAVEQWMATQHHLSYIGQWDDPTTDDQRLMAGM
ncbi:uncharacterized protein BYT42DRAFT_481492, partial [Radiomyces spectabilis]|uniref:uncharacterized protein n=1 Tax=Radiomyces spectabilis TaxID=64574 RepID=UPI002220D457